MPANCIVTQLTIALDGSPILDNLNFNLPAGISGLVAPNGRGKSVLLRALAGKLCPDSGSIEWLRSQYYVDQLVRSEGKRVVDALDSLRLYERFQRIAQGRGSEDDLEAVADHWSLPSQWEQQLLDAGLNTTLESPIAQLSGGQRTRLALAAAFLRRDCYLLLDEPSNHLDRQGRAWLRQQLSNHPGGALVASHDRELLEAVGNVYELGPGSLRHYGGNYTFYRNMRDAELASAEQSVEHTRKELRNAERQRLLALARATQRQRQGEGKRGTQSKLLLDARKNRAQQSRGKLQQQFSQREERLGQQLQEEKASLEQQRMQQLAIANLGLRGGTRLHLENLTLPFGIPREPISLTLQSGARWHVSGANGSGKSTLLKVISGELPPASGECQLHGRSLYLDQDFSLLDSNTSSLENLLRLHPDQDITYWRTALGNVRLRGELALRPLETLSGGERLKVALLAVTRGSHAPDLLLLDEPDNHLDLDSRQLLETALRNYSGTFLLVSHDPMFVQAAGVNGELML